MRIKMLRTTEGSPNGISVRSYSEGEIYDLPETLARVFIHDMNVAEEIPYVPTPKKVEVPTRDEKALTGAPNNKMETGQDNKGKKPKEDEGK